jgi:hypothetical protein
VFYLYGAIKTYLIDNFNKKLYLATLLWVAILLSFNYYYDFEDSYIDSFYGSNIRVFLMFIVYAVSYYFTCWLILYFTDSKNFFKSSKFWGVSLFGFIVLAFDRGNSLSQNIALQISEHIHTYLFIFKTIMRWLPLLTIISPLLVFYYLFQKHSLKHFYGLNSKNVNLKPYLVILLIMLPIIGLASLSPSFLKEYPNFRSAGIDLFCAYIGVKTSWITLIYEFSYAFGFFTVELFFRGFLIFGLVKYLGNAVILPMAVTYCVLHFGKPFGEALSSLFGGYILGIIALKTENIYGGIIVHIGIAWLMELFAYIQL